MDITEVRIKLMECDHEERLLGFCSITFENAFVIRDLKIIRGGKGPFVAMPSRKLTDRCSGCGCKNQLRAAYCNACGTPLDDDRSHKQVDGKAKLYADIAHPINSECRDLIQSRVLDAYEKELILAEQAGYVCRYEDYGENESKQEVIHHSHDNMRVDQAQTENQPHISQESNHAPAKKTDEFGSGLF